MTSPAKPHTSRAPPINTTAPPIQPLKLSAGKHGVEHDKGAPTSPIGVSVFQSPHHHSLTLVSPKLKMQHLLGVSLPRLTSMCLNLSPHHHQLLLLLEHHTKKFQLQIAQTKSSGAFLGALYLPTKQPTHNPRAKREQ